MASLMDRAPKAAQKLQSKGGECNKLYVPELKAIAFWFFYRDFTGGNTTILKKLLISLNIIIRPWRQPMSLHFLYRSRIILLR